MMKTYRLTADGWLSKIAGHEFSEASQVPEGVSKCALETGAKTITWDVATGIAVPVDPDSILVMRKRWAEDDKARNERLDKMRNESDASMQRTEKLMSGFMGKLMNLTEKLVGSGS